MNPTFLSLAEVLESHHDQINRYGSDLGIRDLGLPQSAIATPEIGFGGRFLHTGLREMAAAYPFHIVQDQDHPFIDGNKRDGAVAALVFMALNDVVISVEENAFERIVSAVAKDEANKATIAEFFRGLKKTHLP